MEIGTRVYSKEVEANGYISDRMDESYKVRFFWAKYAKTEGGRWQERPAKGTKWHWCKASELVPALQVAPFAYAKTVKSIGNRSLDRLIRRVCEIGRRRPNDDSDIVINYGSTTHRVPNNVFMINRNLIMNKMEQCNIMGDLAPRVTLDRTFDGLGWIIKPFHSIGGRGIRSAVNDYRNHNEYYQEMFDKVREFRVHCFLWMDEPVTFIQEKVIKDPTQLTWNKKQGGKFQYPYQPELNYGKYNGNLSLANVRIMTSMSVQALKALKMDFGGLDFGMDANGKFKIFEVNSRMGLRERSFYTYKNAFQTLRTLDIFKYKQERGF